VGKKKKKKKRKRKKKQNTKDSSKPLRVLSQVYPYPKRRANQTSPSHRYLCPKRQIPNVEPMLAKLKTQTPQKVAKPTNAKIEKKKNCVRL
jgi:hypothetical protein